MRLQSQLPKVESECFHPPVLDASIRQRVPHGHVEHSPLGNQPTTTLTTLRGMRKSED